MEFKPDKPQEDDVPCYEDAKSADGWNGAATGKTEKTLLSEVKEAIEALGGVILELNTGSFTDVKGRIRRGVIIKYIYPHPIDGNKMPGSIEIASLPCRNTSNREKSMCLALYNARDSLKALYVLQKLSPGFLPLMPFMLTDDGQTMSQRWASATRQLPEPGPEEEIIDGN